MAKTTEAPPAGMDRTDIRKHVKFARHAPVHIAFALGGDGKAILSMDKRKPPRALEKALKDESADSRNHRFGTLTFLPDQPKTARIVMNKPASGMARKLVLAMKGTGIRKIELVLEDGTAIESAQGEDDADGEDENDDAAPEAAWQSDAEVKAPRPIIHIQPRHPADAAPEAEQAPQEAEQPAQDADALKSDLTALVKRMMAVIARDPSQKAGLIELATDAQASLKRGDLAQAEAGIEILRQALDAAPQEASPSHANAEALQPPNTDGKRAVHRYRKSRQVWLATRAKVDADIQKLSQTILAMYQDSDFGDALEQSFLSAVDPVLSTLDDSLASILSNAEQAEDAEEVKQLLDQARTTIGLYQDFVAGNETIAQLDANPFMPIAIGKTLGASLGVLAASMH